MYPANYVMGHPYVMGGAYGARRYGRYGSRSRYGVVGDMPQLMVPQLPGGGGPLPADHPLVQLQAQAMQQAAQLGPLLAPAIGPSPVAPGYTPPIALPVPDWRGGMLAPGVPAPKEKHIPIPMNPDTSATFTVGGPATLTFTGRPQSPFIIDRLLVVGLRNPGPGGSTATRVLGQMFAGTKLQQGELGAVDIETIGAANAFNTELWFDQAEPGVLFRIQASLAVPLAIAGESLTVTITALGKNVG